MKNNKLIVHAWEINDIESIVVMDKTFMKNLKHKAISVGYSKVAKKIGITKDGLRHIFYKSSTRLTTMLKIAEELDIELEVLERNIVKFGSRKRKYNIRFPLELTPLHLRVVSHLIGDGTYSSSQWNQLEDYESYMLDLLSQIGCNTIKPCHYSRSGRVKSYTNIHIPKFLVNVWEKKTNSRIVSRDFIKFITTLPREYGVQLIIALIVDEGHIPEIASNIWLGMRDYGVCKAAYELCLSLGYEVSFNKYRSESKPFYRVSFSANAISQLEKDIKCLEDMYGKVTGLWHKSVNFKRRCSHLQPEWQKWRKEAEEIRKKVIKILNKMGPLRVQDVVSFLGLPTNKTWSAMRSSKNLIRRKNGFLSLPNDNRSPINWNNKIKNVIKIKGWSYRKLSKILNVSPSTICHWVNDRHRVSGQYVPKIWSLWNKIQRNK